MKELAIIQAEKIKAEKPKYSVIHRKDGDADFVSALLSELASEVSTLFASTILWHSSDWFVVQDLTLLVTVGEDNNGQMTLVGREEVVSSLGPKYVLISLIFNRH